mmetsp:Transcript_13280/g.38541  ORF Transcript_13280/g.38541 Transcript_13280/m.38541 type:complete len:318 (-) Transcript_13280:1762-2715(-)
MLWVVLHVLGYHAQGALKDGLENFRDFVFHFFLHPVNHGGEQREDFGVTGIGDVPGVVAQDGVQHCRHVLLDERIDFARLCNKRLNEPKRDLFNAPHRLDRRAFGSVGPAGGDGGADQLGVHLVHVEHIHENAVQLEHEGAAQARAYGHVGLEVVLDVLNRLRRLENLRVNVSLLDHVLPELISRHHQTAQIRLLFSAVRLGRDHDADRLVEHVDLVQLKVLDGLRQVVEQFAYKWLALSHLEHHKLFLALGDDLQEGLAGHVLHARVGLVHELKLFVDDRLEELPMVPEEPWILPHHVHDVGRDDRLVVLATGDLA